MATSKQGVSKEKAKIADVTAEAVKAEETKVQESNTDVKKPAEKKTATKKAVSGNTSSKAAAKKSVSKKATEKKAPAEKKVDKKAKATKEITYEDVVALTSKKVSATDMSKVPDSISCQIAIYGKCDGKFYIEIKDGNIAVEPWDYVNADVQIYANTDDFVKIVTGKLNVYDAIINKSFEVFGDTSKAILLLRASF